MDWKFYIKLYTSYLGPSPAFPCINLFINLLASVPGTRPQLTLYHIIIYKSLRDLARPNIPLNWDLPPRWRIHRHPRANDRVIIIDQSRCPVSLLFHSLASQTPFQFAAHGKGLVKCPYQSRPGEIH